MARSTLLLVDESVAQAATISSLQKVRLACEMPLSAETHLVFVACWPAADPCLFFRDPLSNCTLFVLDSRLYTSSE